MNGTPEINPFSPLSQESGSLTPRSSTDSLPSPSQSPRMGDSESFSRTVHQRRASFGDHTRFTSLTDAFKKLSYRGLVLGLRQFAQVATLALLGGSIVALFIFQPYLLFAFIFVVGVITPMITEGPSEAFEGLENISKMGRAAIGVALGGPIAAIGVGIAKIFDPTISWKERTMEIIGDIVTFEEY